MSRAAAVLAAVLAWGVALGQAATPTPTSAQAATSTPNATSASTPNATPNATPIPNANANTTATATGKPDAAATRAASPGGANRGGKGAGSWSAHPFSAAGAKGEKAQPRSLTGNALAEELREGARQRQAELDAVRAERERLEKLRKEIDLARAALKEETGKLEERIQAAAKLPPGKGPGARPEARAAGEPGKSPIDGAAKALRGMKPDQAVQLLGRLERPLAVELLRRMRPAEAAALLDRMKPESAAEMVVALAGGKR